MVKTRLNLMFNIDYPILQEGIDYAAGSRLVAAVSESGGLGVLPTGAFDPDQLENEIKKLKEVTDKPYAVSVSLTSEFIDDFIDVIFSEGVEIVITRGSAPGERTRQLKERGCRVIHEVTNVLEAKRCESMGVDAVIARGMESGGYNGIEGIGAMVLTPLIADAVKIPVIASGGIVDGRSFSAALCLGAEGIQVGTRFAACWESQAHQKYKEALVNYDDRGTVVLMSKHRPLRVLKNEFARKIQQMEESDADIDEIKKEITREKFEAGIAKGDVENGLLPASQGIGLIKSIKSARDVIKEMLFEIMIIRDQFNKYMPQIRTFEK